ncbi:hypothetical protein BOX15_Mlig016662g1 [Macrostomum lignano]|uniref:HTH OST-type domain-containing protein n=1 Tax=Macrostomum lignano TaxID=282301 RepID=A0A267EY00_9PLAT|nr:hypothetical protein BOX15_Mlig016662g1 [Macrostomum lignano]
MADDQKINLRCVLISSKEGVPIRQLMRDYRQLVSADLDLQGYPNLTAYLRSIPEIVRLSNENGEVVCHGVASERSSHIEALISKQRSKKKKRPSARGGRGGRGNSLLGSGSSASLRGRSSMSSASSFSSLSSASAFSAGASAYRGRPSADRAPFAARGGLIQRVAGAQPAAAAGGRCKSSRSTCHQACGQPIVLAATGEEMEEAAAEAAAVTALIAEALAAVAIEKASASPLILELPSRACCRHRRCRPSSALKSSPVWRRRRPGRDNRRRHSRSR